MRRLLPALLTVTALLVLPGVATAAPPSVTTGAPSNVYSFQATANATIDVGGEDTTVRFVYGTDATLTTGTQLTGPQVISTNGAISTPITGLTPATTYFFRVTATNPSGNDSGAIQSFSTAPVQVATTDSATNITSSSALLLGTLNPNGLPTQARFIWGTSPTKLTRFTPSPSTVHLTGSTAQQVAIPLTGLPANTTIYYQLRTDREAPINESAVLAAPVRSFKTERALTGISASATRTKFGSTSTVSGAVSGAGIGGVTVVAQIQRYPFTEAFRTVATGRTTAAGRYLMRLPRIYSKTRVRVSTSETAFFVSPTRTINVEPIVGLIVRSVGGKRVFSGSIRPRLGDDARARIQRRIGGRWVTVRTLRLTSASAFSSRYTTTLLRRATRTSYRVKVTHSRPDLATGISRTRTLG